MAHKKAGGSTKPHAVYNIGNHTPVELMTFIKTIEEVVGQEAKKNFLPMQNGDVVATYADVEALKRDVGFEPKTANTAGLPAAGDFDAEIERRNPVVRGDFFHGARGGLHRVVEQVFQLRLGDGVNEAEIGRGEGGPSLADDALDRKSVV